VQGLGNLPLVPLCSPRALPPPLLLWPSGGPPCGAGFPPTLGFWRFQSPCVRWCFPFSLMFKAFSTSSPFLQVSHCIFPCPHLPSQHRALTQSLPAFLKPPLHSSCWPDAWGGSEFCLPILVCKGLLKMNGMTQGITVLRGGPVGP
jgi:hypothetical protein